MNFEFKLEVKDLPDYFSKESARIRVGDVDAGVVGKLSATVLDNIEFEVGVCELDLDLLFEAQEK
ncbi:hypothetical protein HYT84_02375 [Candidatus Micrarchaeota archaeon]|nr:hypothetical protein [Candidatus Micrarchaeota archaeon]